MTQKQQNLPHYGIKEGFKRVGKNCVRPEMENSYGKALAIKKSFVSISAAKRFMRTGAE